MYLSHIRISPQQGLYRIKGEEITFYTKEQMGTPSNQVVVVKEDSRKTLWVGTTRGLASMYNEQWDNHSDMYWLKDAYITAIQFDYRGNVWIASTTGLTVYNPRGVHFGDIKPIVPDQKLKSFPNPAQEQTTLELWTEGPTQATISIHNFSGKLLRQETWNITEGGLHQYSLALTGLSQGMYVMMVHSKADTSFTKVVRH